MYKYILFCTTFLFISCKKETNTIQSSYPYVDSVFNGKIDLNNLENYANPSKPNYINKDNTASNPITDGGATLGRILFYDKNLSRNNTIACASCHQQQFAFSDTAVASIGVSDVTGRHSMRLINSRFSSESKFFWDERAASLEIQTTTPIKDHGEMGFSGTNGDPSFNDLITKLSTIGYYKELFKFVYGSEEITETKIQNAIAQFIRSIQSYDAKYDAGRSLVNNDNVNFSNFTAQENQGKELFLAPPQFNAQSQRIGGGLGCAGCHRPPEFDIDPNTGNNGIIGVLNGTGFDLFNTKAPSLRDVVNIAGNPNGPMMHTGVIKTLQAAIGHYGTITVGPNNTNLDPRLQPNGIGQQLQLTATEVNAVIAFMKTLTGTKVYTEQKWSNPF
jgi:cytochrome c peroxidase